MLRSQRLRPQEFKRTGDRVAKRFGVETHPSARPLQVVSATLDLARQVILALAGVLQFRLGRAFPGLGEIGGLNLESQPIDVAMADTALELPLNVVVDDLGQAAEFLLDRLRFGHQDFEHAIFGAWGSTK